MSDIKWIKLATNMHEDEKMRLIDAMPERDTVHYVWIRLLLLGGKTNSNGEIFLSEDMPLTANMLSILFSRSLASIKLALKTLSRLGMIEIAPNKIIRIVNWEKHQNIEGMERVREQNRKRAENHREKKRQEKKAAESIVKETYENEDLEENKTLEENEELDNVEVNQEISISSIDNISNGATNEVSNNNLIETTNVKSDDTKKSCNVAQNKSNVTITEQNKKEIENKKKNKNEKKEIEIEKNNTCSINNKSSTDEEVNRLSYIQGQSSIKNLNLMNITEDELDSKAMDLMRYHEKITGIVGGRNYAAYREAVEVYGEKWSKIALYEALKTNKIKIEYAIGILKNWQREGYPKEYMEVNINGVRSTGKINTTDKNEFAGFKPKKPRKLTEAERKRAEANLI